MSTSIPPSPFLSPLSHLEQSSRPRVSPMMSKSSSPPQPHPSSHVSPSPPARTHSSPAQLRAKEQINLNSLQQRQMMMNSQTDMSKQPPHRTYYATHSVRVLPQSLHTRQLLFPHVEAASGELADDEFSQLQASPTNYEDADPSLTKVRIEEIKTVERIVRVESKLMEPLTQAPSQRENGDTEAEREDRDQVSYTREGINHPHLCDEELDGAQPTDDQGEDANNLFATEDTSKHVRAMDDEDGNVPWTQVERAIELEESFAEDEDEENAEEDADQPMHSAEEVEDDDQEDEECTDEDDENDDNDQTEFQILSVLSHRINSDGEYEYLCRWTPVNFAEAQAKDITFIEDSWEAGELLRGTPILKNYWKSIADDGGFVPAAFLKAQVLTLTTTSQTKSKPLASITPKPATNKVHQPKQQPKSAPASISGRQHDAKRHIIPPSHIKHSKSPVPTPLKRESSSASFSSSPVITEQGDATFVYVPAGSLLRVNKLDHSIELLDISAAPVQTVLQAATPITHKTPEKKHRMPQSIACMDTEFDLSFTPLSASSHSSESGASTTVPGSGQQVSNPRKRTHDLTHTSPIHSPKLTSLKHPESAKHHAAHMHVTFEEDIECTPKKKQRTTMHSRPSSESPLALRATPPQSPQTHSFVVRTPVFAHVR